MISRHCNSFTYCIQAIILSPGFEVLSTHLFRRTRGATESQNVSFLTPDHSPTVPSGWSTSLYEKYNGLSFMWVEKNFSGS